jgi:hypothetical protein
MAETVIDRFEAIKIEEQQREPVAALPRCVYFHLYPIEEKDTIGQPCKGVVMSHVGHLLLGHLARGGVSRDPNNTG